MSTKYGWNYNTGEYLLELKPENVKFGNSDVVYNPDGSISWKNNGSSQPYIQFVLPEEARCHMGSIVIEYVNSYSHSLGKSINYVETPSTDSEIKWDKQFNDYSPGIRTFTISISNADTSATYALKVFTAEAGPNTRGLTIYSVKFVYAIGVFSTVAVKTTPFTTEHLAKKIFFAVKLDHLTVGDTFDGHVYACNDAFAVGGNVTWEDVVTGNDKCTITITNDQTGANPGAFIVGVYTFNQATASQQNGVMLKVEIPSTQRFVSISGMALKCVS